MESTILCIPPKNSKVLPIARFAVFLSTNLRLPCTVLNVALNNMGAGITLSGVVHGKYGKCDISCKEKLPCRFWIYNFILNVMTCCSLPMHKIFIIII